MSSFWNGALARALLLSLLLGIATLATSTGDVYATGLSTPLRIEQEVYKPLVPVTKNFKTCFKTDTTGNLTLGICTETTDQERMPASTPSPVKNQ